MHLIVGPPSCKQESWEYSDFVIHACNACQETCNLNGHAHIITEKVISVLLCHIIVHVAMYQRINQNYFKAEWIVFENFAPGLVGSWLCVTYYTAWHTSIQYVLHSRYLHTSWNKAVIAIWAVGSELIIRRISRFVISEYSLLDIRDIYSRLTYLWSGEPAGLLRLDPCYCIGVKLAH